MADIVHRIGISAPISQVYEALTTVDGLSGWWTRNTSGHSEIGGKLSFRFLRSTGEVMGGFDMNVVELVPNKKVQWKVVDGPADWIETDIVFHLSEADNKTIVIFGHKNWRESNEHMSHCSMKWATFLLSLRELVETGKGKPAPEDLKIDNWN